MNKQTVNRADLQIQEQTDGCKREGQCWGGGEMYRVDEEQWGLQASGYGMNMLWG